MIEKRIMQEIYNEMQTPYKVGMVLQEENAGIDCPNVFRVKDGIWGMVYAKYRPQKDGYETWYAQSTDLLHWEEKRVLLEQSGKGWDALQADGGLALINPCWAGDMNVAKYEDKYWMSYIGGALPGYETDPLSIGMACTKEELPGNWERIPEPVLTPFDEDVREFEKATLYKSTIIEDKDRVTGRRFIMYYNAKQEGIQVERICMAVSDDMLHWKRHGGVLIENGITDRFNICGDPQLIRYRDLWIMNYFVAKDGTGYDTFACSRDLLHWTKWDGEPLIKASQDYDRTYAHKPFLLKYEGKVYHFYCAVGDRGRGIALAVSEKI